jgi:hypothetical protein
MGLGGRAASQDAPHPARRPGCEGATVIALPLTGAPTPVSERESVTFARTRAEGIR